MGVIAARNLAVAKTAAITVALCSPAAAQGSGGAVPDRPRRRVDQGVDTRT